MIDSKFCSILSKYSGEPLAGTAPFAENFVFISWPKKFWNVEALEAKGGFPKGLKSWMMSKSKVFGKISIRLISREGLENTKTNIYIHPGKFIYEKVSPDEIPKVLDLHFQQDRTISDTLTKFDYDQIFICSHGRHDKCCAKFGHKLAEKMRSHVANQNLNVEIWESSHLGGHRFAPTFIDFPTGRAYGRLSLEEIPTFFEYRNSKKLYAKAYRGSVYLSELEQVAEAFIQHYCFTKKWSCEIKIKNLKRNNENKFGCTAVFNSSNGPIYSQKNIPTELAFSFVLKEFMTPSGCDGIFEPTLRKCWEIEPST